MSIDKKKVSTLFALTLLILSLVAINFNLPTRAQSSDDLIYLHGPSLTPIHMNSNITLTPVHMHHTDGILQWEDQRLYEPDCTTNWTRLYPDPDLYMEHHLSSWNDTNPDGMLSPNDQIDMTDPYGNVTWYHVDRMTVTLLLSPLPGPPPPQDPWPEPAEPTIAIELKWPWYWPEIKYADYLPPPDGYSTVITTWHEVWPSYSNAHNLTSWMEDPLNPNFRLDPCDVVDLTDPNTGAMTWWHVEDVATDLILREKIMDPICTWWHEIYPEYCNWHHLTSWEDTGEPVGQLSPSDQIDMVEEVSQNKTWYHVDRVTVTLNVTDDIDYPTEWMKIELKTHYFEEMYEVFKYPWNSLWHEVYPYYSNIYNLTEWDPWVDDNCNFVLDPCDWIWLQNMTSGDLTAKPERWHIADMTYDLILNKKISDPVSTWWHALYPPEEYCNWYHIDDWTDTQLEGQTGHGLLSPCDNVSLNQEIYHVENVTITLNLAPWEGPGEIMFIESTAPFEEMYLPKTAPWAVEWHEVWPIFDLPYYVEPGGWEDNCNGVLDYCDNVTLLDATGFPTKWHVEEVAVDMVVKKIVEQPPPPPPPMYWKANYPDYAPSGVPDFNQRQGLFNPGMWTWCVPTAVANCLWWMDSRFETSTTPPPAISNTFDLVSNYTPGIDDHDPLNVDPFINHLAYLMDTDGIRTTILHAGTNVVDAQAGIAHYLSWTGLNPLGDVNGDGKVNMTDYTIALAANNTIPGVPGWNMAADIYPVTLGWPSWGPADNVVNQSDLDLINAHMNENGTFYEKTVETPDFVFIEEEIERSEDVILGLDFYNDQWEKTYDPLKELGHAVTAAGVNSTSVPPRIAISDPDNDNAEPPPQGTSGPGRVLPPPPHPHPPGPPDTVHNNASYVSHDIYNVTFIAPPPFISNASWALQGYPMPGYPIATVEWAIIVSPLPVEEVCGVEITDVVTTYRGSVVNGGFTTWTINVTVTVHNNGTQTTDCTVNAYYYNATTPDVLIGTQVVPSLIPCNPVNVTFSWNLASLPECTSYTVKANATCLCTASDEFVDGQVKVRLWGDASGDGVVDGLDKIIVGIALFTVPGDPLWNPYADVSGDGVVDGLDKIIVGIQLFKSCPPPPP